MTDKASRPLPYVTALPAKKLFADLTYQRDLDEARVQRMADDFDPTLLGVLEVSDRGDGTFAILDGQHRWAATKDAHPERGKAHLVCQVHRGLTIPEEARVFYEVDVNRRALSGWDRWKARRGSGDEQVLAIEQVVAERGLRIYPTTEAGTVRATKACERIVALGGVELLGQVLDVIIASFGTSADGLDGLVMHGIGYVLATYSRDAVDTKRLIEQLQAVPPRQIKARAGMLREAHKGEMPRLTAAVIVDKYNGSKGPKLAPFLAMRRPHTKTNKDAAARHRDAIRSWASRNGYHVAEKGYISKRVREAYEASHPEPA